MKTRRAFTAGLTGVAFAATSRSAFAGVKTGGTLNVAFDGASILSFVLDAHNLRFAPQARIVRSLYDNLVVLREDQSVAPWLASSWQISADRTQYIFNLRQDVSFHDGTKFDAAAVKFNFDRVANKANALQSLPEIGPYTGSTVLSPYQIRLEFSTPFEPLLRNLSSTGLGIVSPAAVQKYGALYGINPVGTGPFKFDGLTQGSEIRLSKNAAYNWAPPTAQHQGPAYLDNLIFTDVPEQLTRIAALQSGQVQVGDLIPSQSIAAFRNNPDFNFLQKEMLDTTYALEPNAGRAPWDDFDVRNALRLALDIDLIVRVVYLGTIERAWSPLSHKLFGSAESQFKGRWAPDPNKARAILDSKGWKPGSDGIRVKDGKRLSLDFVDSQGNREQRLDVIQLIRRQINAVGIDLVIDEQSQGTYLKRVKDNDFDLAAGAQYAPDPDVLSYYYVPEKRSALQSIRFADPGLAQLLRDGATEGDPAKRAQIYLQAQERIIDQVYQIPIYILRYNIATAASVQGAALDAHGFPTYYDATYGGD